MSDKLDKLDYYTLLGIADDAPSHTIRDAFHRFARKYHPDNHDAGSDKQRRATQIFRRGAEGYRILRDPELRRRYDEGLSKGRLRLRDVGHESSKGGRKQQINVRARPFFQQAKAAFERGDKLNANLQLRLAMQYDSEHPDIVALAEALEAG